MTQSFASLGLSAELVRAVSDKGYTEPTPIQARAIPAILGGRDVFAAAQTGTGKTAGFTLPLLQRLNSHDAQNTPRAQRVVRALILTPTRELAAQVEESVRTYGKHLPLKSTIVYGGVGMHPQVQALRRGVDILVATPGRLLDHVGQNTVSLKHVEILVLDEADRMLDMGFIHDIKRILALLPKTRQSLMFSATLSDSVKKLAEGLVRDPETIAVARNNVESELVTQRVHAVDTKHKTELLTHLINTGNWQQVLVFSRTKHGANRLAEKLSKGGLEAVAIHGNKSQSARMAALTRFKKGSVRVLVATDVAARGLDIQELPYVVNFDLPNVPEDYVHRIGRTGRAGSSGEAISLVAPEERHLLRQVERVLNRKLEQVQVTGFVPTTPERFASAPSRPSGAERSNPGRGRRGDERAFTNDNNGRARHKRQDGQPSWSGPAAGRTGDAAQGYRELTGHRASAPAATTPRHPRGEGATRVNGDQRTRTAADARGSRPGSRTSTHSKSASTFRAPARSSKAR